MSQQSHFWVYIQKTEIMILKRYLHSHIQCSIIRSEWPSHRASQWPTDNRWRKCGMHIQKNIIQSLNRMVHESTLLRWDPLTVYWSKQRDLAKLKVRGHPSRSYGKRMGTGVKNRKQWSNLQQAVWPPLSAFYADQLLPLLLSHIPSRMQVPFGKIFAFV